MDYNLDEETIEVLSESENEHEVAVECKTETPSSLLDSPGPNY